MKKVLLTGATGMLGKQVAKQLSKKGIGFKALASDLTKPETLEQEFEGIDAVIHCAGLVNGSKAEDFFKVNAGGTSSLVKAAEKASVKKFVHISTMDVVFKKGAYSISKLEGENSVKNSGLNWVVIRPTALYDAGNSKIAKLVRIVKSFPLVPVIGSGNKKLQPVWAEDVAIAVIKSLDLEKAIGKTYSIASEKAVTFNQIVDIAGKKLGKKPIKLHLPLPALLLVARASNPFLKSPFLNKDQLLLLSKDKTANISLAKKELGFKPKTIEEGIELILKQA